MVCGCLEGSLKDIDSGEDRRALCPLDKGIGPGAQSVLDRQDLVVKRELHTLKNGTQIFYSTVAPASREPEYILCFNHGYTLHGDIYMEAVTQFVDKGAMLVLPDLPSWGRSDGLLGYFPDWWKWMDLVWEFLDGVVVPMKAQASSKPLKLFCAGHSLGGGVTACLAVMRPTFFDGVVLVAPMLVVGDDVKPGCCVQAIFKTLIGPLKSTLPLAPSAQLEGVEFRVPSQGEALLKANPLSMGKSKPRLATAQEMAFTFPDWMEAHLADMLTPFLVVHGTADKITDPAMSKRLHETAKATDKQIILYEGGYHRELIACTDGDAKWIGQEFTPEQKALAQQCMADMSSWLSARA